MPLMTPVMINKRASAAGRPECVCGVRQEAQLHDLRADAALREICTRVTSM
jgi:hypothetical protein